MKVVLLAGGFGTRISEESQYKPKPMIEIGGMPILWHIMKEYSYYGHNDFIICAGYKQEYIKEWFANYFIHNSDVTFDYRNGGNEMTIHESHCEPWRVTVVDTGYNTMTDGRIDMIAKTNDYIYIFEFKYDKSAEEALRQIDEKGYAKPFACDPRKVIKIDVNFSKEKRCIDGWKIAGEKV